jgi:hypothetical protein
MVGAGAVKAETAWRYDSDLNKIKRVLAAPAPQLMSLYTYITVRYSKDRIESTLSEKRWIIVNHEM